MKKYDLFLGRKIFRHPNPGSGFSSALTKMLDPDPVPHWPKILGPDPDLR
jgi:hypothetical protein